MTTSTKKQENLDASSFLISEFDYIAQTAFQAQEDRARVSTFYLVSVGSLVGAILGTPFQMDAEFPYWIFSIVFSLISAFGLLTILQLIRLRQAWYESARAMNQIKRFFLTRAEGWEEAFRWRTETLPSSAKAWSISFLLTLQVALLDGVTVGAAILYAGWSLGVFALNAAITGGALFFLAQVALFFVLLRKSEREGV